MNSKDMSIDWLSILALCAAMMVWASSFIALKSAIGPLGPMSVIFGRMAIASLCFVFFINKFIKQKICKDDVKYLLIMVFLEPCLYFLFEAKALQFTSASNAGMITSLMPLMVALIAGIFLGEVITKRVMLGAFLAIFGAIWLSMSSQVSQTSTDPLLGNFLEFLAMVCGAGYSVSIRHLTKKFTPLFLTAFQSFAGAVFFLPFFLWEFGHYTTIWDTKAILWVIYLGVAVTLGGYGLFNFALSRMQAYKASVYINLIPVFTILLAFLILDEKMSFMQLLASGIILTGVIISEFPDKRVRKRAE